MKALVVVAHGSRREASNEEVRLLAENLSKCADGVFERVIPAFLELAEPSIPDGIEQAILDGADEVLVFPYFLTAGRHVAEDIPAEVEKVKTRYPNSKVSIASYLGAVEGVTDLILGSVETEAKG